MKHKRLTVLFCLSCLFLIAGVLTACRQSVLTKEKIYEDGYNCEVIFDLAGGTSGKDDRARQELHQYVQSGSPIIKPGTDKNGYSGETPVKEGYTFGGFYQGTKEGDTVTYDMAKKWDFAKDKVTGDLTLYAYWRENYSIAVHYGENYEKTATVAGEQDEEGAAQQVTPAVSGHTVIAYFADRATAESALADPNAGEGHPDEQRLQFPMTPTVFSEDNKVWDIYANALEGNFTVVRTKTQFQFYGGTNIYLMTDIDYEEAQVSFPANYSGTFYGNGHTVSNFKVTRSSSARNDAYLGLFNRLMASSHLENVTFDNFELDVSTTGINARYNNYIGALAGIAEAGATLQGVTLNGKVSYSFVEQNAGTDRVDHVDIGSISDGFADTGYQCNAEWVEKSAS